MRETVPKVSGGLWNSCLVLTDSDISSPPTEQSCGGRFQYPWILVVEVSDQWAAGFASGEQEAKLGAN